MTSSKPDVTLAPVASEEHMVLQNLFELYAHDFSEHMPLALKPTGRFDLPVGDTWWKSEGHHAFFIREAGKLAGFALAKRGSRVGGAPDVLDVAEFFVVRGARRRRIGETAAHALFSAFPGQWEVRVRRTNAAANAFWCRVVTAWTGRPAKSAEVAIEGVVWDVLHVESPRGSVRAGSLSSA